MANRNSLMFLLSGIIFVLGLGAVYLAVPNNSARPGSVLAATDGLPIVVVYKNSQCGCCEMWAERMEEAGFTVEVNNVFDLSPIKARYRVPQHLGTCHTAEVGDYVIEGHVPADAVKRLLKEQPDVVGLAVPRMPKGSPGMEQGSPADYDHYQVLAFHSNGGTVVFETY